jgi:hypothetical protein
VGKTPDQRIHQTRVPADVGDHGVVATRVLIRVDNPVPEGTVHALWIAFPDRRRLAAQGDDHTRQQATENAVTDNQLRQAALGRTGGNVVSGRGEGQQHAALTDARIEGHEAGRVHHHAFRSGAEQAAHVRVPGGAGHKHPVTDAVTRRGTGRDDATDRFVTGNQGIGETGKSGHRAVPEQALRTGADAAPQHLDHAVIVRGLDETDVAQRHHARFFKYDRFRRAFHSRASVSPTVFPRSVARISACISVSCVSLYGQYYLSSRDYI